MRVDQMPELDLLKMRADIGMVFQENALFDSLTVAQNVGFRLSEDARADRGADRCDAIDEVLGFVGLTDFADRMPCGAVRRPAPPRRHRAGDGVQAAACCCSTIRSPASIR